MQRTVVVLPIIMVLAASAWALKITAFMDTQTFVERARDIVIAQCLDFPTKNDPAFRENGLSPVEVRVEKVIKGDKKPGKMKIVSHYPMEKGKRYLLTSLGGWAQGTDFLAVPELSVVRLPERFDNTLLDNKTPEQQVNLLFKEGLREAGLRPKQLEQQKRLLEKAVGSVASSRPPSSLAEKVAQADAIVVGKVAEIETKRYLVTLFEKGSDGKQPSMTTYYDLAVLHPEKVLKTDSESIVNKADKSNPVDWMHMAYQTPGQKHCPDSLRPSAQKGERYIWFLRRDLCMTGSYFIRHKEVLSDATLGEIDRIRFPADTPIIDERRLESEPQQGSQSAEDLLRQIGAAKLSDDAYATSRKPGAAGDDIPKGSWSEAIRELKPIKVYMHRGNIVCVLKSRDNTEEGIYIYVPVSSYMPMNRDDGFAFTPIDGDIYRFERTR